MAEPLAGDPARAHADDRLHGLEPGALGILPRVEEAEEARPPVRLGVDRDGTEREGDRADEREEPKRHLGDEEDARPP